MFIYISEADETFVKDESIAEIKEITAFGYNNVASVFKSDDVKEELLNIEKVLLLNIELDGDLCESSCLHFKEFSKECSNKSLLISLKLTSHNKFIIYWKQRKSRDFLKLELNKESFADDYGLVHDHVVDFLTYCLSRGENGNFKIFLSAF